MIGVLWVAGFVAFVWVLLDHIKHSGMLDDHGTAADRKDDR